MSEALRIAVDFDSTLAETWDLVIEFINFKHGTHYTRADVDAWAWAQDHGYGDAFWATYDLMDRLHLRRAIRPTSPFACATVKALVLAGHSVEVVTSNHASCIPDMEAWLFGHGLDLKVVPLGRQSAREKLVLGYDLFIDDAPALAEELRKQITENEKNERTRWPSLVVYEQPWNRSIPDLFPRITRLVNWQNGAALLTSLGVL